MSNPTAKSKIIEYLARRKNYDTFDVLFTTQFQLSEVNLINKSAIHCSRHKTTKGGQNQLKNKNILRKKTALLNVQC